MVEVVSFRTTKDFGKPGDVRIDRGSKWGNPFHIGKDGNRDQVCDKYQQYFEQSNLDIRELIDAKRLFCWCAPLRCHGDYLKKRIEELKKHV